ncbi:uncharacterized protein LOC123292816 [Chrysoperla carnea]|uniref:uncharacterized protein LOC123292816 n=1 Tax=Chrysoperla carnea TaxID=189513 RepID=UPI001D0908FE|nr:uncharacterized protein LOC123292816 [Chrysoperla carnea]
MASQENTITNFLEKISKKLTVEVLYHVLQKLSTEENVTFDGITQHDEKIYSDSFSTCIYHFKINGIVVEETGNKRSISFPVVVKGLPSDPTRRKIFRSTDFFENEINFYTKVWPKLLHFQKSKDAVVFDKIPRCLLASLCDGKNDFIILEDVTPFDYKLLERNYCLDIDHCMLIIKLFADFHSVSFAFKNQHPKEYNDMVANLKENYFSDRLRPWYRKFLKKVWAVWTHALEKEMPNTIYERKFEILMKNDFYGQIIRLVKIKGKYSVVCQGEALLSKFLFKYNENIPESAYLMDFQHARNSSLIIDLAVFLFVCVGYSVRTVHWDELLTEYHKTFTTNLQKFGTDPSIFSYRDFLNEFLKYGKFGLGKGIEAIPLSLMNDYTDENNPDAIEEGEHEDISSIWKVKIFESQAHTLRLADTVKDMVDRGFLEQHIFSE